LITLLHPTATIHPDAELHPTVQVGAHAVIGAKVAIGVEPQDPITTGANSLVKIGDDNQIREYVTISRSNRADEVTMIGDRNLLMAYIHMAQGCVIENNVVIANAVILGEHVHVESRAFISGIGEVYPFVHIGRLVMVAFMHQITCDIPPYMLVEGQPARVRSLNRVGLKRAGLVAEQEGKVIQTLRTAFRLLYRSGLSLDESLEKLDRLPDNEHLLHLKQFLRSSQGEGRQGLTPGKELVSLEA
jgi:UDP-N-acetylglucosamine acyltransferase